MTCVKTAACRAGLASLELADNDFSDVGISALAAALPLLFSLTYLGLRTPVKFGFCELGPQAQKKTQTVGMWGILYWHRRVGIGVWRWISLAHDTTQFL